MSDVIEGSEGLTAEQIAARDAAKNKPWFDGHEEEAAIDVNGEKLSLKQLKEGHLRQADYTRKTQDLAKEREEFEASKAKPAEKPAVSGKEPADWPAWSRKLYEVLGNEPGTKLAEIAQATASEQLTAYEVTKEVDRALEENYEALVKMFGDEEKAKRILWNELREELVATQGKAHAKDVTKRLLSGLPPKAEETKGKMKPEREGSPVGAQDTPPKKFNEHGEISEEYHAWSLARARKAGELAPAEE